MKAMLVGDVHLADRPPSVRVDTYKQDILDKLDWIVTKTNESDAECLVLLGDVFHIKRPDRNSHKLVQETSEVLTQCNVPVRIVPGNHDVMQDSMESLPSQPLGTLALHPSISLVSGPDPDFPMFGVPYFDPNMENFEYWVEQYRKEQGPDKYQFIIAHQAIFPKKEEPIYDYVSAERWATEFEAKWTAYGHIHSRMKAGAFYKIPHPDGQVSWFCNNGAISRGSLHEETINRKLAVTMFDSENEKTQFVSIPIPYKPAKEVFNMETVEFQEQRDAMVDSFLTSLGGMEFDQLTLEGILAKSTSLPAGARKHLSDIMEEVTSA